MIKFFTSLQQTTRFFYSQAIHHNNEARFDSSESSLLERFEQNRKSLYSTWLFLQINGYSIFDKEVLAFYEVLNFLDICSMDVILPYFEIN